MSRESDALVVDLVEYVAERPRPYAELMEAWRTSCPRLTIWEDAVDRGLVCREIGESGVLVVKATAAGLALLRHEGRSPFAVWPNEHLCR